MVISIPNTMSKSKGYNMDEGIGHVSNTQINIGYLDHLVVLALFKETNSSVDNKYKPHCSSKFPLISSMSQNNILLQNYIVIHKVSMYPYLAFGCTSQYPEIRV